MAIGRRRKRAQQEMFVAASEIRPAAPLRSLRFLRGAALRP